MIKFQKMHRSRRRPLHPHPHPHPSRCKYSISQLSVMVGVSTPYRVSRKHVRYSDTEAVKSNIDDQVVEFAFTISVTAALRDRRDETPVIMDELQRMLDMHVWRGVHMQGLSKKQRRKIIPSKMFLKTCIWPLACSRNSRQDS
jgi:hypothetical protein